MDFKLFLRAHLGLNGSLVLWCRTLDLFTRSFVKQQIYYVRALGDGTVLAQKPRTQQLVGWYTRAVTSLDEYYHPSMNASTVKDKGNRR